MRSQTRIRRTSIPYYRGKIFFTFDSTENKVSIYHPKEGVFFLSKSNFEKIDKKVTKLLKVDSSYDQFLLLPSRELCGYAIMKNYFDWQKKLNE